MSHEDAAKIASMMLEYFTAAPISTRSRFSSTAAAVRMRTSSLWRRWLERGIDVIPVATKCDKLRRSERAAALKRFDTMGVPPIFCSATSGEGIDDLRRRILAVDRAGTVKRAEAR